MSDREGIAAQAKELLEQGSASPEDFNHMKISATISWGIQVERVEIKDIRLPRELCRAMAAEAEASRESDARIVCAIGERNVG